MNFFKNKKGFTLIELLVIISIIGFLASMAIFSLNMARMKARDAKRIADIKQINTMIQLYYDKYQTLPRADYYGERNSSPSWWDGWWDLSSGDGDGDGNYFLDFLVDGGITKNVPVDPLNDPADYNGFAHAAGHRYVYFLAPKNYNYQGGSCAYQKNDVYLLAITDLETDVRPSQKFSGSDCECLWKDSPGMFEGNFDYLICGSL